MIDVFYEKKIFYTLLSRAYILGFVNQLHFLGF
jgi:hypothetical protein